MSLKLMVRVLDFECGQIINGLMFKPAHKWVLLCYADHGHDDGTHVYPGVPRLARRTGYSEREVQYLTRNLEGMGLLVPDGSGPMGTNRFRIPLDGGGAKIAPVQTVQGAKSDPESGAKSDPESGAKIAPELLTEQEVEIDKEKEAILDLLREAAVQIWPLNTRPWEAIESHLRNPQVAASFKDGVIKFSGVGKNIYENYSSSFSRALIGTLKEKITIEFEE